MRKFILILVPFLITCRLMAGIVVTEINFHQHNAISTPWSKAIDINNDGKADVTFSAEPFFGRLIMADSSGMATCIIIPDETPQFFNEGDSIGSSLQYMSGGFLLVANDSAEMPINTTLYIGYTLFNVSTLTWHYGWLSIELDWFHEIFYIYESGYNDVEEMPIAAGQKSMSVPENNPDNVKVFSNGSAILIENLPEDFLGRITVYDLTGKLLFDEKVKGTGYTLSGEQIQGVVIVSISSPRLAFNRKILCN
ncbi:MAG: hypothetical protein WCO93_10160 [bacterium]